MVMPEQLAETSLDPDRPFARIMRGEPDLEFDVYDVEQWIADWLDYAGVTAEELIDRHARRAFEGWEDRLAWMNIENDLERAGYVQTPAPPR